MRVTLKSLRDVENVLLSAHLLRASSSKIRIFPDIPWTERQGAKKNKENWKQANDKKSIFVHGIPELNDTDMSKNATHDCQQWSFVQQALNIEDTLTVAVKRLPTSPLYKGTGPRIMKVTFQTEEMVTTVLESWYHNRRNAPSEIRLRSVGDKPRQKLTLNAVDTETTAKNDAHPAPTGSVVRT